MNTADPSVDRGRESGREGKDNRRELERYLW